MGALIASFGALGTFYPEAQNVHDKAVRARQIARIVSQTPALAAYAARRRKGEPIVPPAEGLSFAGNFLHMLKATPGQPFTPDPVLERALDILFILHADHEQNCSTFAMRSVGSSFADPFSSVAAAAAALYGPLHGGANEAVLRMLHAIGSLANVPAFIKSVKGGEGRLMGFGHRVYKSYDPRARIVKQVADEVFEVTGQEPAARNRAGAGAHRAAGRLLRQAQALPERRLLLGADLRGDGHPGRHVHGALRDPADVRLAGAVGRDARSIRRRRSRGRDRSTTDPTCATTCRSPRAADVPRGR